MKTFRYILNFKEAATLQLDRPERQLPWSTSATGKRKLSKTNQTKISFCLSARNSPKLSGLCTGAAGRALSTPSCVVRRRQAIKHLLARAEQRRVQSFQGRTLQVSSTASCPGWGVISLIFNCKRSGFSSKFTRCSHSGNNYLPSPPAVPRSLSDFLEEPPPVAVFKQHEIWHRKGSCLLSLLGQDQKGRKEDRT